MEWLNYHHLRYFTAVVDEGGLAAAARHLGVTHPTVSEQLKKLEEHLDLTLFRRKGRQLQLTEEGKMVYGYAGQIFGIGSALLDAVEGRRSGRTVLCRVGVDSVLPKLVISRALAPVVEGLGESLHLRCVEDERIPLLAALRARNLDLVLSDGAAPATTSERLISTLVGGSELGLFTAPTLARALKGDFPACLDGAPFLLPMPATRIRRELERWLESHRLRPRVVAEMEDSGLIKIFGQEGRGVFAMPLSVAKEVMRHYEVQLLGVAEGVTTRVYAMSRDEPHPAVDIVRALESA